MSDLLTLTPLETQVKDLICVTRPYYALKNLQQIGGDILQAEILVENIFSGESTLIFSAEAGRHLAILGSCALALQNPLNTKHYYLANQAYLERAEDVTNILHTGEPQRSRLVLQAKVVYLDLSNKIGKVETKIMTQAGDLIFKLDVSYQVLKADLFQKLFRRNYKEELNANPVNPYTQIVDIQNLNYRQNILSGDLGIIQPEQCVGHFDHYPALPIAILCGTLAKLGSLHLKSLLNNDNIKYTTKKVPITANRLAFAGEHVLLHSTFISEENNEYTFYVKATNDKQSDLGDIQITFELLV